MMKPPEFPTVRRPFVLMVFAVLLFYLAVAMAQAQSAGPVNEPTVKKSFVRFYVPSPHAPSCNMTLEEFLLLDEPSSDTTAQSVEPSRGPARPAGSDRVESFHTYSSRLSFRAEGEESQRRNPRDIHTAEIPQSLRSFGMTCRNDTDERSLVKGWVFCTLPYPEGIQFQRFNPNETSPAAAPGAVAANHSPRIIKSSPLIRYYPAGGAYDEYFVVHDSDVMSRGDSITMQMNAPAGFTFEASRVSIGLYGVRVHAAKLPERHVRMKVTLLAKDLAGAQDLYTYEIAVSDPPLFALELTIANMENAEQQRFRREYLTFGIGAERMATTGLNAETIGRLDTIYCEYELPPAAPIQQFDARWEIPLTTGTFWNIYPEFEHGEDTLPPWYFTVNPGGNGTSEYLPITIAWSEQQAAKAPNPLYLSDRSGSLLRVDMRDGSSTTLTGSRVERRNDSIIVTISLPGLNQFMIRQEYRSGVEDESVRMDRAGITCVPNPTSGPTEIRTALPGARRAEIFDGRGVLVRTLTREAGEERFMWDGGDEEGSACAPAIYHCRIAGASCMIALLR